MLTVSVNVSSKTFTGAAEVRLYAASFSLPFWRRGFSCRLFLYNSEFLARNSSLISVCSMRSRSTPQDMVCRKVKGKNALNCTKNKGFFVYFFLQKKIKKTLTSKKHFDSIVNAADYGGMIFMRLMICNLS